MYSNLNRPNYKPPFKFWCQRVLPLVYEDSLSYYETLGKVVNYVNGLRDDIILTGDNVDELEKLYNELKELVNKYYETGVQDSIDKKLDEMAESGYFDNILRKYFTINSPMFFETTTDLIKSSVAVGAKVRTSGYYAPCDGGACDFIISSEEKPYSVKLNNNLYANICNVNGVITPEMFGAKGDGVSDDSVPLQKAMDCLNSPDSLNIFKGTKHKIYGVTNPIIINLSNSNNGECLIDFNGSTIIALEPQMMCVLQYTEYGELSGWTHHPKNTLTNVCIEGNNENAHTGLYIVNASGALFTNINLYGCRRGIYLAKGYENEIRNCFARRNASDDIVTKLESSTGDNLKGVFPQTVNYNGTTVTRGEVIEDGKINLIRTQCIGFEMTVTDSFITNCITVDFVIGIKVMGGDNKVDGCHPWNASCEKQIYSSCCVFTSSGNYFTNLTCDRFYIGVYSFYNLMNYFTNTLFTNQPMKFEKGVEPISYCWYIGEQYANKGKGATIIATNTQINGNRNVEGLVRHLKWCNITPSAVKDINTHGFNILDYMPVLNTPYNNDTIKTVNNIDEVSYNTYGTVKSVTGTIPLDPLCDNDLFTVGNTSAGFFNNTVYNSNAQTSCEMVGGEAWITVTGSNNNNADCVLNIGKGLGGSNKFNLVSGHKYLTSMKYKNTNPDSRTYTNGGNVLVGNEYLEADGEEHLWWNMFEYNDNFTWAVLINKNKPHSGLSVTNIRLYDITNVPMYFLENRGAYFKRITDYIGGLMESATVAPRDDISFIATQFPIEFKRPSDVYAGSANFDWLANFYTVRYDSVGKPMVWCHKNTIKQEGQANLYFDNCADIPFNKHMNTYFNAIRTNYQTKRTETEAPKPQGVGFRVEQFTGLAYQLVNNISGSPSDGDIVANRFGGNVRLIIRSNIPIDVEYNTITHFRADYTDECDYPVVDNGGITPLYHMGGIYPILKGSGEDPDFMRELPTICYEIEY